MAERLAERLHHRRIDRDHVVQIERIAEGEAADAVGPSRAPAPGGVRLPGLQEILLGVVEDRPVGPRVVLPRRRREGAEVAAVPFGALDQVDVIERGRRRLQRVHLLLSRLRLGAIRSSHSARLI